MLVFPTMLVGAAKEAGMEVPEDPDNFETEDYPHFAVFCNFQLGKKMQPTDHWHNAKIIAAIPEGDIKEITYGKLHELGCV